MLEQPVCDVADEKLLDTTESQTASQNILTQKEETGTKERMRDLARHCNLYKGADNKRAAFQLVTTLGLFLASAAAMVVAIGTMPWITVLLLFPTAGLLVRLFIIQHDCGHGAFFRIKRWNDMTGRLLSLFTFTPYGYWRRAHNMHHAGSGGLDRRGAGGIDTLTVVEYKALTPWKRFQYRLYRNPVVLLVIGTPFYTLVLQRLPLGEAPDFAEIYNALPFRKIWKSIVGLNFALIVFYGGLMAVIGVKPLLLAGLPVLWLAGMIGGWLFYIQHQFEHTYWEHDDKWNFSEAAVMSSSYYDLPPVFQWFTGNIGLHHIHHLCSAIPNYRLQECLDSHPELSHINRLTFRDSLKCVRWRLWDEVQGKMVTFRDVAVPS